MPRIQDLPKLIAELEAKTVEQEAERASADAIFDSIGDGAIATDEQGKITRVNQIALDLLGFSEKDLVDKWYPSTIIALTEDGKGVSALDRPITKSFLSGHHESATSFYQTKSSNPLPVLVTVSPIMLDDKPVGAIEVFRDYSKELETDRMKSDFIGIASHQLRTPLTSIMLNSHMLADGFAGSLTKDQQQLLDAVVTSTDRMTELVTMLLNITRVEAGRVAINPVSCDLKSLAEEIIKELEPKSKEKSLEIRLKSTDLPKINTDEAMIKEIIANYISNAIKYTPKKGVIEVAVHKDKDYAVIGVKDSGYGIPKKEQKQVFSKFYRGENIIKKETVGTGLGLYLVKTVAESLGGTVGFESEEGKGSTFWVRIPLKGIEARAGTTVLEKSNIAT